MRNILAEKPPLELFGRMKESAEFVNHIDLDSKSVLDIGCGYGWFEIHSVDRNVKNIVGIEISEEGIQTAKNNLNDPKIGLAIADSIMLPFKDRCFDTVVCWEVIEHIPKKTETYLFQEIVRVLKDNGTLYLSTPFNSILSVLSDPAWWLMGHRHYTLDQMFFLASQSNLTTETYHIKGRFWDMIEILDMYFSKWILRREPLYKEFLIKKIDIEYKKKGFMTLFCKFTKSRSK